MIPVIVKRKNNPNPSRLRIARTFFLLAACVGLFFRVMQYKGAALMLIVGFTGLAACYFIMAITNLRKDILLSVMYLGISLCLGTLLTILAGWLNLTMLTISLLVIAASLILIGCRSLMRKRTSQ